MPNTWFTADFHFGHNNIIRYCNRPFRSVEEMDQTILERLNASVKPNDILYFLGDFCIGSKARVLEHRKHIRCRKVFALAGNHDKEARKLTEEFTWLNNLAEISIHGQPIVLCHYAMRVWNRVPSRIVAFVRTFTWATPGTTDFSFDGRWSRHP